MHLIDVTNSYAELVHNQLNSTSAQYVKVYSLGNTTVIYTQTPDSIEIVMENHDRRISDAEVDFVIKRLIKTDVDYNISVDNQKKIISITCAR